MPSHQKRTQTGVPRTLSANCLTGKPASPLELRQKSVRIIKRKQNRKQAIQRTLSLRRSKIYKNSKDQQTSQSDDNSVLSTTIVCSSERDNDEEISSVISSDDLSENLFTCVSNKAKAHPNHRFYTDHVMMCEPTAFYLNEETVEDNKFMHRVTESK